MSSREEHELTDLAMNNAYDMLVRDFTYSEIIDKGDAIVALPFNIHGDWDVVDVLDICMTYFIETEEYEKCAKIRDVLEELKPLREDELVE